jgi:hypothetical protein
MLEYRRFRIMLDLAYNINPPIFKPLIDPDDLYIVDLLAQGQSYLFNPDRSKLNQTKLDIILNMPRDHQLHLVIPIVLREVEVSEDIGIVIFKFISSIVRDKIIICLYCESSTSILRLKLAT